MQNCIVCVSACVSYLCIKFYICVNSPKYGQLYTWKDKKILVSCTTMHYIG